MISLIVKLMDLTNALLNHFVYPIADLDWDGVPETPWGGLQQLTDYEWIGDFNPVLTNKGNETVGALSTVIHMGSMFLAQLMLLFNAEFYNTAVSVSGAAPL